MVINPSSKKYIVVLILLAVCLLFIYFIYCFIIPQTPARISRPSFSLVSNIPFWSWINTHPLPVPHTSITVAVLLLVTTIIAFAAYGCAIFVSRKLRARSGTLALVLIPTSVYFLLSTFALPNLNTDIFNYILRGRLAAVYNLNPYRVAADEISNDPVYPYASHGYTAIAEWWKLPLWTSIEFGLAKFTGENVVKDLFIFRLAFLVINVINLFIITTIIPKINPRYLITGLILYAWNPIIVLLGQSKGDTFILFFLLLAILLIVFARTNLAIIPLTMSVLIKMTTLPFLAAYLLMNLKRRKWRDYIILGVLFIITAAIFYLLFDVGDFITIQLIGIIGMSGGNAPNFIRILLRAGFVVLILIIGLTRSGEPKQMIWGWVILGAYLSLFLIDYGKAWYLIPLIGLASLIPSWRTVSIAYFISLPGFLIYNWDSVFNKEFSPPILIPLPGYVINIIPLLIGIFGIGAVYLWKKFRPKNIKLVVDIPGFLSEEDTE